MVSCEPFQSYKIALKNCEHSVIEHNLVTIYLNLEWPENRNENPNLLIHIFDKKISPKICKTDMSMSYLSTNPSTLVINHHHQEQHFPTSYHPQYYSQSSLTNDQSLTVLTPNDHNDVSSTTTTTLVLNAIKPQTSTISSKSMKPNVNLNNRRQSNSHSPQCSSSNQSYLSSQPLASSSSSMETINHLQPSSNISPIPSQQTLTQRMDFPPSSSQTLSSYPLSTTSSTFKTLVHESTCPTWTIQKQTTNGNSPPSSILCRVPGDHRSLAQRAAVASQIRTNRTVSMTNIKEQGQTPPVFVPMPISNGKPVDFPSNNQMINKSEPETMATAKKKPTVVRQRSLATNNSRARKRTVLKQISLPTGMPQDVAKCSNDLLPSMFTMKDDSSVSPTHVVVKSPTKLLSPFSIHQIQTKVSNADIDQTIDEVINGKVKINIDDPPVQVQPQPSSQLVWVQNGAVTTKTWLSPLYQKQQMTTTYDSTGSTTLTHQDVVNIAQQVVCPSENEQTKLTPMVLPSSVTNNSKRRNRSKSTSNTPLKRNRQAKSLLPARPHSNTTTITNGEDHSENNPIITPTLNLINKPTIHPNGLSSSNPSLASVEKNDIWPGQHPENVDTMLDEFQFVSIDEQRACNNTQFDFDLSIDRFPSITPPPLPPINMDHQRYSQSSAEKYSLSLTGGDVDVYEHFFNPMPISSSLTSSAWQENQVTSSVSTPPDFQLSSFSAQPVPSQQQQQYYAPGPDEHFDSFRSQVRLLFDVQS